MWQASKQHDGQITNLSGARGQGQIVACHEEDASHKVRYDDDAEEWLTLSEEKFQWLSPRGISAGCCTKLQVPSLPPSRVDQLLLLLLSLSCHNAVQNFQEAADGLLLDDESSLHACMSG